MSGQVALNTETMESEKVDRRESFPMEEEVERKVNQRYGSIPKPLQVRESDLARSPLEIRFNEEEAEENPLEFGTTEQTDEEKGEGAGEGELLRESDPSTEEIGFRLRHVSDLVPLNLEQEVTPILNKRKEELNLAQQEFINEHGAFEEEELEDEDELEDEAEDYPEEENS